MRKLHPNDRVLLACSALVVGMLGLTYASVPLYRMFCQLTGYDGTPRVGGPASTQISDRTMEIRFDTNTGQELPWEFRADAASMSVRLGENAFANFRARNTSTQDIVGSATFNVTPLKAAQYVSKTQCFCVVRQELKAGRTANYGVVFFVDPDIAKDPETKDIKTLTFSYTFFPAKDGAQKVAEAPTP